MNEPYFVKFSFLYSEFRRNGEETLTIGDQTRTSLIYFKNLTICLEIDVNAG